MSFSYLTTRGRRFLLALIMLLMVASLIPFKAFAEDCPDGMSILDCQAIYGTWVNWVPDDGSSSACSEEFTTGTLPGADNAQKAYNYFVGKGLSTMFSAAIVGNFVVESAGVNPKINQLGGGPGRGIAQWSVDARWQNLLKFAQQQDRDPYDLGLQLDFVWAELHGTPPAGDYSAAFKKFQEQTNIEDATGFFMGTSAAEEIDPATEAFIAKYGRVSGYENPGTPHLDHRIEAAKLVVSKYGNVSGSDSACIGSGSVNCDPSATADTSISPLRQKVVCLTEAELALWESGKMKPGTDFFKYSQNRDEMWCADFISWIYNEAGYPVKDDGNKWETVAYNFKYLDKFEYHTVGSGYVPRPGDVAIHSYSHVNIVVSVKGSGKNAQVTVIGGNQTGDVEGTGRDSKVTKYSYTGYGGDRTEGYASPKGDE